MLLAVLAYFIFIYGIKKEKNLVHIRRFPLFPPCFSSFRNVLSVMINVEARAANIVGLQA